MIRIVTYSTKPRGGVVHALALAEAIDALGAEVELWALSPEGAGFFREPRVPARLVPVPRDDTEDIEARILRYADVLADALGAAEPASIHHAEDCLSARALLALRAEGTIPSVVRTIHHVDDFESPVLTECQRASIQDVDHRICVSRWWANQVRAEFGVESAVVPNGIEAERFAQCPSTRREAGEVFGWGQRPTVLAIGGVEPRKGSRQLLAAFARARPRLGQRPLLVVAGGATLFDYSDYRSAWRDDAERLGLSVVPGRPVPDESDVALLGPMPDADMPLLYRAADLVAFPSIKEGFGLVPFEAMAAGTPIVTSDLPVLREHLTPDGDCVMVDPLDEAALADALVRVAADEALRDSIRRSGRTTVRGLTWESAARSHLALYEGALTHV